MARESENMNEIVGDVKIRGSISSIPANVIYPVIVSTPAQALSGAGAITLTEYLTNFTSTGVAQALTLAAATTIGQIKKIVHVVDGGSGVLTGTFSTGDNTLTFTTAGEVAHLIWNGTAWVAFELYNQTVSGSAPVLSTV